jgi:pyruvate ferredoxin oxidoreductase beta subunit
MSETRYKAMKDLPREHLLSPGTAMCAGCGGLGAVKLFYDVLGPNTVFVNAAGCMTMLAIYPYTPFRSSWLYTAMPSAAAGAQGIRDALDLLIAGGKMKKEDDLAVVALMGDGAADGIGMAAISAAIHRGLDFYLLVYDNEGYGNTGHQTSEATPYGARTATAHGTAGHPGGKKDLFAIWSAHDPAYAATICASEPVDLARKVERARDLKGPKLFLAFSPCPTGWHFEPRETVEIGRLAVKTGCWPLKEYSGGKVVHTRPPAPAGRRPPLTDYLERQGRFEHLFRPRRNAKVLAELQAAVDAYWERTEQTDSLMYKGRGSG